MMSQLEPVTEYPMENLLGLAGTGVALIALFALYLGSASLVLKVFDRLIPRQHP